MPEIQMRFLRCTARRCTGSFPLLAMSLAVSVVLSGCGRFGEAMTAHTDIVARAAGKELKVAEAARLLASNPQVPADPQVVQALAEIWVDYTLLATAVAEDTSLAALDLEALTKPAREQILMEKLRAQVIRADTTFTEEEIRRRWAQDGPGVEISARHILLRAPADATPAQRDSVRQVADSLRARAAAGEDFAALATEYSQDPGSAARGGDLGFFGRGRMVAAFEEAAFALEQGEISEVVESPFGYHVIQLTDRRQPDLGTQRDDFREFLVQRAQQEAETAYLDSLAVAAEVEIQPGGLAVVRELASRPRVALRGRAADRPIASYRGGEFTSGEFAEFIRAQPGQMQSAFATADDEQLETVVQQLARREVLLNQIRARDISLTREEEEEIRQQARQAVRMLVQSTGFARAQGPVSAETVEARVQSLLEQGIAGEQQLVPLGPMGSALRDLYPNEINDGAFPQVIQQLESIRASQPPAARPPNAPVMPQQGNVPSDTAG
jgi:peptidyl-prolyl cis-trans isomerase C